MHLSAIHRGRGRAGTRGGAGRSRRGALLTALLLGAAPGALCGAGGVLAQAAQSVRSYAIPSQPLSAALMQFSNASGLQIVFDERITAGRSSTAVSGSLTPDAALSRLLAGSGLGYRYADGNTVSIYNAAAGLPAAPVSGDGSIVLEEVNVTAWVEGAATGSGFQGTPDWVYEAPRSVSVVGREAIVASPARNTRDLLDNVSGVIVNRSEAQNPGIVINMRGVQDQDRVATMIDGARQSFQRGGHGATQRVYVESAFLRGIEVEKTTGAGAGSIGALAGSVNFRTVEADDLIAEGRDWGVEVNATTGTNAYHFDGSVLGSWRASEAFAVTAGLSYKNIGAYEIGQNGTVLQNTTYDGDIMRFSGQEVKSGLAKLEIDPSADLSLKFAWMRNNSDFSTGYFQTLFGLNQVVETKENVTVDTLTAALDWNPADNDMVDLRARLYHNRLDNVSHASDVPNAYTYTTTGGSLENTSRWDLGAGTVSLNYGVEAFHDAGETTLGHHWLGADDVADLITGATPSGGRDMASLFASAAYEDDVVLFSAGLRYDWYHTQGSTTFYNRTRDWLYYEEGVCKRPHPRNPALCLSWDPRPGDVYTDWYYKGHVVEVDRSGGALLPNGTVAVKPTDWLQLFAGYSQSYRPPTVMESFINGSAHQNSITEFAPNPLLEPESARTFEIGANISADSVLLPDDSFRFKLTGFHRDIDNYITFGRFRHPLTAGDASQPNYTTFVNLIDPTVMRGVELEANYDAGLFYIGGNATWLNSDFGLRYRTMSASGAEGVGYLFDDTAPVVFIAPDFKVVLDAGVRLFDEKLTLGARLTHVSETKPVFGQLVQNNQLPGYTTYDVYGSYAFNENVTLRAAITNVTDVAYVSALGATYYAAPGRTATLSLNAKF